MALSDCNPTLKPSGYGGVLCTSDVTCFDGNFTCNGASLPASPSLNDALAVLDAAICAIGSPPTPIDDAALINYNGTTSFGCFTLTGSPPSVQDVIEQLGAVICGISTTVDGLCTDDIDLCNVSAIPCLPSVNVASDNLTTLINESMSLLCSHDTLLDGLLTGTGTGSGDTGSGADGVALAEDMRSSLLATSRFYGGSERSWRYEGGVSNHSGASLDVVIDDGSGGVSKWVVDGYLVSRSENSASPVSLGATQDNYVDVSKDGTYLVTSLPIGSPAPAILPQYMRLFKYETNATGVVSFTDLSNNFAFDGTTIAPDSIITTHILDLNVTGAKLENIHGGITEGDSDFFSIVVDTKGRVTAAASAMDITGLADGQILQFQTGSGNWENVDISGSVLPLGEDHSTLRYDGTANEWQKTNFLKSAPTAVGVGIAGSVPLRNLSIGESGWGNELGVPSSVVATAGGGGALAANTYFYVVVGFDGSGETYPSSEVSAGVDGITTTSVSITFSETSAAGAYRYRIFKGVATGVYTEYFDVTEPSFVDDGSAGTAGSPAQTTNIDAFSINAENGSLSVGSRGVYTTASVGIHNIASAKSRGLSIIQAARFNAILPIDYYGIEIDNTVATNGQNNYGIGIDVSGSNTENIGINITTNDSTAGDNVGLVITAANAGAGNAYGFRMVDGNEAAGAIIISDANGNAAWDTSGATGSFTAQSGETITVTNGIITSIV